MQPDLRAEATITEFGAVKVRGGEIVTGCFAAGSHAIVPTDQCLIQHEMNDRLLAAVRWSAGNIGIEPYDERTGQGVLRHVLGRVGIATGEVMASVSKFKGKPQAQLVVRVCCAIGASDGDFDQTEKDVVRRMCAELELDATAFGL